MPPASETPQQGHAPPHAPCRTTHRLHIAIQHCQLLSDTACRARVVKNGGDDPDATHGAPIEATVILGNAAPICDTATGLGTPVAITPQTLLDTARALDIRQGRISAEALCAHAPHITLSLRGGPGVGTVTLPGLPVSVGEPAINPEPRKQIAATVLECCARHGYRGHVEVTIAVPGGEQRAQRTFNPRLGIRGGLSILGTHGTVKPYSHDAWKAAILQGMDVARACGTNRVLLSTGRRSERLLMEHYPHADTYAFIQVADFAYFSLKHAAQYGFGHIVWGCFFGKLVKLGQGHQYTHAHSALIDFALLAQECRMAGLPAHVANSVARANTAQHAFIQMQNTRALPDILRHLADKALAAARRHAGLGPKLTLHLFDFAGHHLIQADD